MHPRTTTRRAFLRHAGSTVLTVAGVGAIVAGCSDDGVGADPADPAATPEDSADEVLVSDALRDTIRLVASYEAVLDRHTQLRATLAAPRADLRKHFEILSSAAGGDGADPEGRGQAPRSRRAAKRQLADAERSMARRRRRDATVAESGELGRVLASIAASHAQHHALLAGRSREDWASSAPEPDTVTIGGDAVVQAMNATLAGEHAAIYAYGVIGGRLDYDSRPVRDAADATEVHRERRDGLIALVESGGGAPTVADTGYLLPTPVEDVAAARTVAQLVEDRCAVLYATLAATATGEIRTYAVDALIDSAARGLAWGAPTSALPGVATTSL